jgi:hypothetical protein
MAVTDVNTEADDAIVQFLEATPASNCRPPEIVNIAAMVEELDSTSAAATSYFVVRRKRGGSKAEKKLFTKINLRRPSEGACCLVGLSAGLRRWSAGVAKRMKHHRVDQLVEIERRELGGIRGGVVVGTDDVLLADRVASAGGLVLSSKQLEELIS